MPRKKTTSRHRSSSKHKKRLVFLPYPLIIFIFLIIGVLLVGWTLRASAENVVVKAKIPAPLPSGPAVITSPADGSHFSQIPIDIRGTCPTNGTYVKLYRNDVFTGTALCQIDSSFSLQSDLFIGTNSLVADIYNFTDDKGPSSTSVAATYQPLSPPVIPPGQPGGLQVANPVITTDYKYAGYIVGQKITWPVHISEGTPPYAVNVDWGDSKTSLISRKTEGTFKITHTYAKAGSGHKSSYPIRITITDLLGNFAEINIFAIVNPLDIGVTGAAASLPPPSFFGLNNKWLWAAWPAYGAAFLMALSYWLGEREELISLRRRGFLRRRA